MPATTHKNWKTQPTADICDHKILRENCQECPQVEDIAKAKILQIAKAQKFMLRNFMVENMDAFCSWDLYTDPITGKRVKGSAAFLVLLAMCKHGWAEEAKVWPGDKTLANMTGLTRSYVQVVKRTLRDLNLLSLVGQSNLHTDIYTIRLETLQRFVDLARVRIKAPPPPDWMEGFVPDVKGDNFEELREFAEQDEESADIDTDAGDNADSSNGEQQ
jgi:hypothetical protein